MTQETEVITVALYMCAMKAWNDVDAAEKSALSESAINDLRLKAEAIDSELGKKFDDIIMRYNDGLLNAYEFFSQILNAAH